MENQKNSNKLLTENSLKFRYRGDDLGFICDIGFILCGHV